MRIRLERHANIRASACIYASTQVLFYTGGLADSTDSDVFMERLEGLEDIWNDRERECNPCSEPPFHTWFVTYTADDAVSSSNRPIREAASLGCPPAPYYTNDSGSVNSVMYNKTKTTRRQNGITSMHQLVQQYVEPTHRDGCPRQRRIPFSYQLQAPSS